MVEIVKCLECSEQFDNVEKLHRHFRAHKIKIADYYIKHFNRCDWYSQEPIPFKNRESYFDTDFKTKTNLYKWLKNQAIEVRKEYCKNLLKKRIEKKGLQFAPCQVELRSILFPPVNFYTTLFGDYNKFCSDLGLKARFSDFYEKLLIPKKAILCDSREQKPLNLPNLNISTLNFGDYSLESPPLNDNVFIERKSLNDFISTLGRGLERFTNEIERAALANAYIVVLIESPIEKALAFNFLPYNFAKVGPDHIFHNVRELLQRYSNIQFCFLSGRKEMARIVERLLFEKGLARNKDLQLLYERSEL